MEGSQHQEGSRLDRVFESLWEELILQLICTSSLAVMLRSYRSTTVSRSSFIL